MTPEQLDKVLKAARGWVGTPYAHNCAIKGVGVDCGRILIEIFTEAGMIERPDCGQYAMNFMVHRGDNQYLEMVERFADEIEQAQALAGDIAVWRIGRTYSHGALMIGDGKILHSNRADGCAVEDRLDRYFGHPVKFYRVRG